MPHRSNVLDVVRAVTEVATSHPEIAVWWYVPRLLENPKIQLVVELEAGQQADLGAIATKIGAHLPDAHVSVVPYDGQREDRRLFRVLSKSSAP
jgi:hypothetical protein